ncbi:hypothetical protein BDW75DRAFT_202352 [Aspergillus navahoensis]
MRLPPRTFVNVSLIYANPNPTRIAFLALPVLGLTLTAATHVISPSQLHPLYLETLVVYHQYKASYPAKWRGEKRSSSIPCNLFTNSRKVQVSTESCGFGERLEEVK